MPDERHIEPPALHCAAAAPESLTRFFPFFRCFFFFFLLWFLFPFLSNDDDELDAEEIDFEVKKLRMLEPCPILSRLTALSTQLEPYQSVNLRVYHWVTYLELRENTFVTFSCVSRHKWTLFRWGTRCRRSWLQCKEAENARASLRSESTDSFINCSYPLIKVLTWGCITESQL